LGAICRALGQRNYAAKSLETGLLAREWMVARDRTNLLSYGRRRDGLQAFFISHHQQIGRKYFAEFAGLEQEIGVPRSSVAFVTSGKGRVDQDAVIR
jgi:hypothetical protein